MSPPPTAAHAVFGDRLGAANAFAELLAGPGIEWGLLGPRERPRLWDRHLINSALVADLVPAGSRVVDVGSGAGLPGLAIACRRPDLSVDLVEPLQRRVQFLERAVTELGLTGRVRVIRGRAEDPAVRAQAGAALVCTARAVAPLDRLLRWCLPLLRPGGRLLALKGDRAETEVAAARRTGVPGRATLEIVRLSVPDMDAAAERTDADVTVVVATTPAE